MKEWVHGTVVGKHQWSDGLFSMQFDTPVIDFRAGQYTKVALDFERVILVHGVRNRTELTYASTLSAIAEQSGDRFSFLPTLSRERNATGLTGRITDLLRSGALEARVGVPIDKASSHVMLCGNAEMITDVKAILEERGLERHSRRSPGQYSTEQYR